MRFHLHAALGLAVLASSASCQPTTSTAPTAKVRNGTYAGVSLSGFKQDAFLGMPYAQDTGGQNRFRVPQALNTSWSGVRTAQNYGNACPDPDPTDALYGMSENCLSINVVRPTKKASDKAPLPVVVWIHGGSYHYGTTGLPSYNLSYIVQQSVAMGKPILATSINYRKGGWGNMYSIEVQGSGQTNLALRDMRQALAWIQENIAAFGGDPKRVTIWGESSGSFAVGQLLLSYGGRTDGLFHRSIQESGGATTAWYNGTDWYQPTYNTIVDAVNCTDAVDTLDCLRTVPYDKLAPLIDPNLYPGPGWYPTVDGDIMPQFPTELYAQGKFAHVPHIYGTNSDEGTDNAQPGINTDDELREWLQREVGFGYPASVVERIMQLYPDDPAQGVPINTGLQTFEDMGRGKQYKRVAAIAGDIFYHGPRLAEARSYAQYNPSNTFVYRFNTRGYLPATTDANGTVTPAGLNFDYLGVEHATEVPFVFNNPDGVGPWPEYRALSTAMSGMWINFVNSGNPNGKGVPAWPRYADGPKGKNLVLQTRSQGGFYVEDDTYRLQGREYLSLWAKRRHV
ncbi:Alpha/Beta hydrolase protein [Microdochium trichocladiopsis]|uniref:Carboxylic ester hydrolase n=1 Tax=Microdochium trichocladiopsis TaxID=1682393 RepID=A0A9P9BVQ6_9PEZI|nr:Alpha/Beta hydrolase protein [Microdochium trichocladiopsis]KAH7039810.1 Alpha/Beta hydrolase protein [Microdochium trichocladiopsis]